MRPGPNFSKCLPSFDVKTTQFSILSLVVQGFLLFFDLFRNSCEVYVEAGLCGMKPSNLLLAERQNFISLRLNNW
jgi:hypothetical protein